MRVSRPVTLTFKSHLQNVYYVNDLIDKMDVMQLLSRFGQLNEVMNQVMPLLYVIDYTKSQYLIMTNGCQIITGHHPQDFLEGGIPLLIDIFQKDDFKIYNESVFTRNSDFLKQQPQADHCKFIFSYNFRVKSKAGSYVPILQRGSYITSKETGLPLFSLGLISDLSPFKKDSVIYHSIEKTEESNGIITKHIIADNYFYPDAEDKLLSVRERHILECMANGLSSKQIAHKFRIAENTVANHRKNMLRKTNTKNVAELVAFAIRSGLI